MADRSDNLKIIFSVALQDAGESTRSLEIAKGIRDLCPSDINLEIIFLSHGSRFEGNVIKNEFRIYKCEPEISGKGFHEDLKPSSNNFVGSKKLAIDLLKGEIKAYHELKPDIVIHGFWPFASIARRMTEKEIPGICFLPIPMEKGLYGSSLMKDVPDQIKPLTYLPISVRRYIMRLMPSSLKLKAPIMKQNNILNAAASCGWTGKKLENIFDILESDLTIVNDLPEFYEGQPIPENFKIVGPLYAPNGSNTIDPSIMNVLNDDSSDLKIFCTMGSSGTKKQLLEAIEAIVSVKDSRWNAVILAPSSVCPINEALAFVKNKPGIYVTDKFVPAPLINSMVDVVVSHGGQGTVQTAIASGTPVVGVAMQPEQQINLDNVVLKGAGIRIPMTRWNSGNIQASIKCIQNNPDYKRNAERLQKSLKAIDGRRRSAEAIWEFIRNNVILND
jgi:hypothetical protein